MKNVLILHGAGNDSTGNWFPWLKSELEKKGFKVWVPDLPNSNTPDANEWLKTIFSNKDWQFNKESVLIGHSAGATLILRILEKLENLKIDKAILVSAPVELGNNPKWHQFRKSLVENGFDWQKIKKSAKNFYFIHSDNDPYDCGEDQGRIMQRNLGGELIIKKGQGHFNLEQGEEYHQFPFLLQLIVE